MIGSESKNVSASGKGGEELVNEARSGSANCEHARPTGLLSQCNDGLLRLVSDGVLELDAWVPGTQRPFEKAAWEEDMEFVSRHLAGRHVPGGSLADIFANGSRKEQPQQNAAESQLHYTHDIENDFPPVVREAALYCDANNPEGVAKPAPDSQKHEEQQCPPCPTVAALDRD